MDGFVNYDALAGSINAEDITSDGENATLLRRIMSNDSTIDRLSICPENEDEYDYCPAGAREMGWLGYFVGKSTHVKKLFIHAMENDTLMEPFCRGVSANTSIRVLSISIVEGDGLIKMLGPFLRQNHNLAEFYADECNFGAEGCRQLSLALGSCTKKSMTEVILTDSGINGEQFADIAVALSMHPNLEKLTLSGNDIGRNGYKALATLLQFSTPNLSILRLEGNNLDDDAMGALIPALAACQKLATLVFTRNASITDKGWRGLSGLLESPNCALKELRCSGNRIDDEIIVAFTSRLARNQSLQTLSVGRHVESDTVTEKGRAAISTLLCDTSSVNATFLSNHTLEQFFPTSILPDDVKSLLAINRKRASKKYIAMVKVLKHHSILSMQPFFEWDFKVLPHAVGWFDRAQTIPNFRFGSAIREDVPARKLSAIYQFIRGMPLLYVESHLRGELDEIQRNDLKIEQERLPLLSKLQELDQRKQESGERKRAVMARLSSG